jgi:hypothetical protein
MFCATKDFTAHKYRVECHGMLTIHFHVMSLRNCDLRSNILNLFKYVAAGTSVVEVTTVLYEKISTKLNNRKL